jgi:hypothetical protein
MPRPTSPPPLPPDLADGLLDGLRRVAAMADLLETVGSRARSEQLLDNTLEGAGNIIGGEAARMLALLRAHNIPAIPETPAP